MKYPPIWGSVICLLDAKGFEGTDVNPYTSLFEYAGLWSPNYEVAMLCEVETKDPGISFQHISVKDIATEVNNAGAGFASYVDAVNCGLPEGMSAIQSLMMYSGGWHQNSSQWRKLSTWDRAEMLRVIRTMCPGRKPNVKKIEEA